MVYGQWKKVHVMVIKWVQVGRVFLSEKVLHIARELVLGILLVQTGNVT